MSAGSSVRRSAGSAASTARTHGSTAIFARAWPHAVVRASAEVEQSGCVGPRKAGRVEMIRFPPGRRIAARGDNAEKDHRASRNRGVVQVNRRHGRMRNVRDTGLRDFDIFHFAGYGLARQTGLKETVIQLGDVSQPDGGIQADHGQRQLCSPKRPDRPQHRLNRGL